MAERYAQSRAHSIHEINPTAIVIAGVAVGIKARLARAMFKH